MYSEYLPIGEARRHWVHECLGIGISIYLLPGLRCLDACPVRCSRRWAMSAEAQSLKSPEEWVVRLHLWSAP
jgi:hypothetical protein